MDWLDLLAVQGTVKSLLQHHSSKASILWRSAFFIAQLSVPPRKLACKDGVPAETVSHLGSHGRAAGSCCCDKEDAVGSPAQRSTSGSATALLGPQAHVSAKSPARHGRHHPPAPPATKCSRRPSPHLLRRCQHKRPHPGRKQKKKITRRLRAMPHPLPQGSCAPLPSLGGPETSESWEEGTRGEGRGQDRGRGAEEGGAGRERQAHAQSFVRGAEAEHL